MAAYHNIACRALLLCCVLHLSLGKLIKIDWKENIFNPLLRLPDERQMVCDLISKNVNTQLKHILHYYNNSPDLFVSKDSCFYRRLPHPRTIILLFLVCDHLREPGRQRATLQVSNLMRYQPRVS